MINDQTLTAIIRTNNKKSAKAALKNNTIYDVCDTKDSSLLIDSIKSRNIYTLKLLLKQKNIPINHKDIYGKTALDYAIELDGINEDSPLLLQHMQYDMCTLLIRKNGKVTSVERDRKLQFFLLGGKPKYNKTLLGFCIESSPTFISTTAAYQMNFLGPFISVVTNFLGSLVSYSIERISHYRRFKKYNRSFLLEE